MAKKLYYKIGEACKRLDIQPYVLRYWETEFPMLRPDKSSSGQRVYSEKDLATILRIKELLYDEGYTIAGAKKKLDGEDVSSLVARAAKREAESPAKASTRPDAKPEAKLDAEPEAEEAAKTAATDEPPAQKPAPKKTRAKKKKTPTKAAAEASGAAAKELAALRQGVENALAQAREILDLLDSKSPRR